MRHCHHARRHSIFVCMYGWMCVRIHASMYVCLVSMYVYVCMHACHSTYACIHVCIHVSILYARTRTHTRTHTVRMPSTYSSTSNVQKLHLSKIVPQEKLHLRSKLTFVFVCQQRTNQSECTSIGALRSCVSAAMAMLDRSLPSSPQSTFEMEEQRPDYCGVV
jgi:hypothetical protein